MEFPATMQLQAVWYLRAFEGDGPVRGRSGTTDDRTGRRLAGERARTHAHHHQSAAVHHVRRRARWPCDHHERDVGRRRSRTGSNLKNPSTTIPPQSSPLHGTCGRRAWIAKARAGSGPPKSGSHPPGPFSHWLARASPMLRVQVRCNGFTVIDLNLYRSKARSILTRNILGSPSDSNVGTNGSLPKSPPVACWPGAVAAMVVQAACWKPLSCLLTASS